MTRMSAEDCRRVAQQLTPWVDDRLAAPERVALDRHLDGCPLCRRAAALEQGARSLLRAHADRLRAVAVPPGLQRRCEILVRGGGGRPRLPLLVGGGIVLAGAACGLAVATGRSDRLLAVQLAADHLKCFHVFGDPAPVRDDAAEVEAFVRRWSGWAVSVPPSSGDGAVQLLGVRRCLYARGGVPHVMYRANGQDMSLYMLNGAPRAPADVVTLGYRSRLWPGRGGTYVLVSPDRAPQTTGAVAYVMQHAR
jgi:anti-sigma factor RsiW